MKLEYYRGEHPNFGDELNTWLWPQLLPDFFDGDPKVIFLGIGSIIGTQYEVDAKKIIFGTGYSPAYLHAPNVHSADWDVFFVRGPRTARALGLPETVGIGDAAILLRALDVGFRREPRYVGYMPHWESLPRGNWQTACDLAGIRLIDPRAPVQQVLADLLGCEILITEAMHGAIVADALRVPWVPVLPIDGSHRGKWLDWAEALHLQLTQHRLWPSTLSEVSIATMRRPLISSVIKSLSWRPLSDVADAATTYAAAQRLSVLARRSPCLSDDKLIESATAQMQEKLTQLERKYRK